MANEAVIISLSGQPKGVPIRYACANSAAFEKGALLFNDDDSLANSVSGATNINYAATGKAFAGIVATEKVANDGSVTVGLWTKGTFDLITGQVIQAGQLVSLSGGNFIRVATATDILSGAVVGRAMEAGVANEVIKVAVGIY